MKYLLSLMLIISLYGCGDYPKTKCIEYETVTNMYLDFIMGGTVMVMPIIENVCMKYVRVDDG